MSARSRSLYACLLMTATVVAGEAVTRIEYWLNEPGFASVAVCDASGRLVRRLLVHSRVERCPRGLLILEQFACELFRVNSIWNGRST